MALNSTLTASSNQSANSEMFNASNIDNANDFIDTNITQMVYEIITEEQYYVYNGIVSIVALFVAVTGVASNVLTIRTFLKMGASDGATFSFLSLAVCDFLFTLNCLILYSSELCSSIEHRYGNWFYPIDPFAVVVFADNVGMMIYTVSIFIIAYVAIARCMCIAMPFRFKDMFTRATCIKAIIVFVLASLVLHVPYLVYMGMQSKYDERLNGTRLVLWLHEKREKIKDINRLITYFGLSMVTEVIVVVCVVVMTSKLRESVRFRNQKQVDTSGNSENPNRGEKESTKLTGKEKTVVQQIVTISIIFIVCNIYRMVHSWLMFSDPKYDLGYSRQYVYMLMSFCRSPFDCINSSVNFYVYIIFNKTFRAVCFPCLNGSKERK